MAGFSKCCRTVGADSGGPARRAGGAGAAAALAPPAGAAVEAATLPACDYLGEALELGMTGPESAIAGGLAADPEVALDLRLSARPAIPGLESRVAFTEVLGKTGIWPSQRMLLGFTLIAPHTHYPAHVHPAIELYLVIAGAAAWPLGNAPPRSAARIGDRPPERRASRDDNRGERCSPFSPGAVIWRRHQATCELIKTMNVAFAIDDCSPRSDTEFSGRRQSA